jgi:hypothetical protein
VDRLRRLLMRHCKMKFPEDLLINERKNPTILKAN